MSTIEITLVAVSACLLILLIANLVFVAIHRELKNNFASLSTTSQALRDGLFNPNFRGAMGEEFAEEILKNIGFQKDVHYKKQEKFGSGIPDFTFILPDGLLLNMDVKFNLTNYQRCLEVNSMAEKDGFKKQFLIDIKDSIRGIANKDYVDVPNGSLDFVLMFVPNDQIFNFINREDSSMIGYARIQKVVLCSPSSLCAIYQIIQMAVGNFRLNKTAGELLGLLNEFDARWKNFDKEIKTMENELTSFKSAFIKLKGAKTQAFSETLEKIRCFQPYQHHS